MAESGSRPEETPKSHSISALPSSMRVIDAAAGLVGKNRSDYVLDILLPQAKEDLATRGADATRIVEEFLSASSAA